MFGKDFQRGIALDNMIHLGRILQTIRVLINPGDKRVGGKNIWNWDKSNRSYEHDSIDDTSPRYLIEELLLETTKKSTFLRMLQKRF